MDINNVNTGLGWLDKTLGIIEKYRIMTIFKAFFVILLVAGLVWFISNPTYIFEKYEQWCEHEHDIKTEITLKNAQVAQVEMENLLYKTGANRAILMSFHNSKSSLGGLPFIYLTPQTEAITAGTTPVSAGYESMKTSLYPFVHYLSEEEYFCGDIADLERIDKALAYRLRGNDVKHLAALYLESDRPLGVIVLTYTSELDEDHVCEDVEHLMRKTGVKVGLLMQDK